MNNFILEELKTILKFLEIYTDENIQENVRAIDYFRYIKSLIVNAINQGRNVNHMLDAMIYISEETKISADFKFPKFEENEAVKVINTKPSETIDFSKYLDSATVNEFEKIIEIANNNYKKLTDTIYSDKRVDRLRDDLLSLHDIDNLKMRDMSKKLDDIVEMIHRSFVKSYSYINEKYDHQKTEIQDADENLVLQQEALLEVEERLTDLEVIVRNTTATPQALSLKDAMLEGRLHEIEKILKDKNSELERRLLDVEERVCITMQYADLSSEP